MPANHFTEKDINDNTKHSKLEWHAPTLTNISTNDTEGKASAPGEHGTAAGPS
jgi:hypothetical protein